MLTYRLSTCELMGQSNANRFAYFAIALVGFTTYRKKTPTTKSVRTMPDELNPIAPIAQADSGRKYCSGMARQNSFALSGIVPFGQFRQCVSSRASRI